MPPRFAPRNGSTGFLWVNIDYQQFKVFYVRWAEFAGRRENESFRVEIWKRNKPKRLGHLDSVKTIILIKFTSTKVLPRSLEMSFYAI